MKTVKTAYRYDTGTIEGVASDGGFLRARVHIARDGVFPYLHPDGRLVMEAKLPEDIFSEFTIQTARGVPVTDGHPPLTDNRGMVTPSNYSKYVKGAIGDSITVSDGFLTGTETIFDAALMGELEMGRKLEVSIGFQTDIEPVSGEYRGERYDAVQRNIRINHVAHVEAGRAGESVRAYLDAAIPGDVTIAVMQINDQNRRHSTMSGKQERKAVHDDGTILEGMKRFFALFALPRSRGDADELEAAKEALEQAKEEIVAAPEPKDEKQAGADAQIVEALKAQISALQALLEEKTRLLEQALAPAVMDAAINARIDLIDLAKSAIPDFKHDGLSARDIKLAVIEKVLPFKSDVKLDSLDNVRIDAQFEAAASLAREKAAIRTDTIHCARVDEAEIEKKRAARLTMHEPR